MKLSSFLASLAIIAATSCKKEDSAQTALPGRRMSEAQVMSLATTVFPPGPGQSQYHVSFKEGIWEVSCESNHITKAVRIQDADGKIEPVLPKTGTGTPRAEGNVPLAPAPMTRFVRAANPICLDTNGSCLVFTNASDGRLSFVVTWIAGGSRTSFAMPDQGFFKKEGWFVYIESPARVWIYDGVRQLDLVTADGRNAVTMPGVFETCPQKVWDAIPESLRKSLHDKRPV